MIATVVAAWCAAATPVDVPFEVQQVVPGVHVVVRREPPGLWFDSNSVFVVGARDVVVVDTNVSPESARASLAELRRITDKPVRYVVNTHWHDDHLAGNQVYRDAFPGVQFVGHVRTRDQLSTTGAENRKQALVNGPGFARALRQRVEDGKSLAGAPITDEERAAYLSDARLVERYAAELPGLEIVFPTVAVSDRMVIDDGSRTIEVLHLGRGHTGADLVVHLPKERVAIVGDLVSWPVPLVGTTSHPADFASTLRRVLGLGASVIVPGHGPVQRDDAYLRLVARLLAAIRDQTAAAVARGETLEQARKSVDLSEFRKAIAGDSALKQFAFDNYVAGPGVAVAHREAQEAR
jgi:glyoxylase-like metal-dependent hydrolase (beta-lactamase superfamily II)